MNNKLDPIIQIYQVIALKFTENRQVEIKNPKVNEYESTYNRICTDRIYAVEKKKQQQFDLLIEFEG